MKKIVISRLFLYKHRFIIGYLLLFLAFLTLITLIPLISPAGLSEAEMASAAHADQLSPSAIFSGEIVDLPYHLLQKLSISTFGLSLYAIKLPSIILGLLLGFLLILLLNRWFKNNVAIITSVLTVLTPAFLYLAGSGTPLIMLVFWPTLLLWLGSKIQGKTLPKTIYSFLFGLCLFGAAFTPFMLYFIGFILIYTLLHPHLRFTLKSLPKIPFILAIIVGLIVGGYALFCLTQSATALSALLWNANFSIETYTANLSTAFAPFFTWSGNLEGVYLSPMISLASIFLALCGLLSSVKGFFASRNSIASLLIIFTVLISGLNPDCAILIILPLAILTAHGVRYLLEKWYGLFPKNPYARLFGLLPLGLLISIIIISGLSFYVFGYRYIPAVANEFQNDLELLSHIDTAGVLLIPDDTSISYQFYQIFASKSAFTITADSADAIALATSEHLPIITFGQTEQNLPDFSLSRLITSPKSQNSDRIYLYQPKE